MHLLRQVSEVRAERWHGKTQKLTQPLVRQPAPSVFMIWFITENPNSHDHVYYRRVPGIHALPRVALEAEPLLLTPRTAPGRHFHWQTLVSSPAQPWNRLNLPATPLHRHQTSAATFDIRQDGQWMDWQKATYVINRCEVDELLVEGCRLTRQNTGKHLPGVLCAFFVFAA